MRSQCATLEPFLPQGHSLTWIYNTNQILKSTINKVHLKKKQTVKRGFSFFFFYLLLSLGVVLELERKLEEISQGRVVKTREAEGATLVTSPVRREEAGDGR